MPAGRVCGRPLRESRSKHSSLVPNGDSFSHLGAHSIAWNERQAGISVSLGRTSIRTMQGKSLYSDTVKALSCQIRGRHIDFVSCLLSNH